VPIARLILPPTVYQRSEATFQYNYNAQYTKRGVVLSWFPANLKEKALSPDGGGCEGASFLLELVYGFIYIFIDLGIDPYAALFLGCVSSLWYPRTPR
jgi:hypothetical protein